MLHISPDAVLVGRRMAEFDEILARLTRQRDVAQDAVTRLDAAIKLLEEAKATLGADKLVEIIATIPDPKGVFAEPKRARGILPPRDIASAVRNILLETGRPMKRGALVKELERRQIPLAGTDRNKNLGTILWRHQNQFVSLNKLGYWLKDVPLPGVYEPED